MIRSNDKVLKTQSALLPIGSLAAKWLGWALVFLLLITITGLALRYYFTSQIPGLSFNNIKHGHSHTAMLGWAFMAAAALLLALFSERTAI
jgi:polyferredoxin